MLIVGEELIDSFGSKVHLTNKRIIYLKGGLHTHYKDVTLKSIDSIEYSKERSLWMLGAGLIVLISSFVLSFILPKYTISAVGTGAVIMAFSIIMFVFFANKEVIIKAGEAKMQIKGTDMDFIKELRDACSNSQ